MVRDASTYMRPKWDVATTSYAGWVRSNLRVAQNGRFVYPGSDTMVSKFWFLNSLKAWKMHPLGPSAPPSLKTWILHCLRKNFPEILRDFDNSLFNSTVYFLLLKESKTVLILKLVLGTSFTTARIISDFVERNPLLMMIMVAKSNGRT